MPSVVKLALRFGPSPRAWGKRILKALDRLTQRTIPTGVGKTPLVIPNTGANPDHPHGRGENTNRPAVAGDYNGPSPRAWGKLAQVQPFTAGGRTIPTGVGKTGEEKGLVHGFADHPHGRGENQAGDLHPVSLAGPSPRAWGKPVGKFDGNYGLRTIPTGVGKTKAAGVGADATTDHPHGRGENQRQPPVLCWPSGPSPRAWGKPGSAWTPCRTSRTIPTGVGKTPSFVGD